MIHFPTEARSTPTTSASFDEDRERGEIDAIVGIVNTDTGIWIVARTTPNSDPRFATDLFRAYPPTTYSNRVGLVCVSGTTREAVVADARRWS